MTIEGGCRCGAVRYALMADALPSTYACHCLDCQTWTGSAFSLQAFVPEHFVEVAGPLTVYDVEGKQSRHFACATCHTRIYNVNAAVPGLAIMRAGTLDDSQHLVPSQHIWVSRKQSWFTLPADVPSWPENPTRETFVAAMLQVTST